MSNNLDELKLASFTLQFALIAAVVAGSLINLFCLSSLSIDDHRGFFFNVNTEIGLVGVLLTAIGLIFKFVVIKGNHKILVLDIILVAALILLWGSIFEGIDIYLMGIFSALYIFQDFFFVI